MGNQLSRNGVLGRQYIPPPDRRTATTNSKFGHSSDWLFPQVPIQVCTVVDTEREPIVSTVVGTEYKTGKKGKPKPSKFSHLFTISNGNAGTSTRPERRASPSQVSILNLTLSVHILSFTVM